MAIAPAAATAAYQAIAKIGTDTAATSGAASGLGNTAGSGSFADALKGAVNEAVNTIHNGEAMSAKQAMGKADMVSVVNAVNSAELTLDTVVAVRDKVIQAYQSIMNMPI